MTNKIINLIKQLEPGEKQALFEHIQRQYAREEKKGMLRDDIRDRIIELLHRDFNYIEVTIGERDKLQNLELNGVDITGFTDTLLQEFDLDSIEFSITMEWQAVSDIVNYVEDALENRGE